MNAVLLMLAGAISVAQGESQADRVCGYALEAFVGNDSPEVISKRYVDRMEERMDALAILESDKRVTRLVCEAYLQGALKIVQIADRKVAARQ